MAYSVEQIQRGVSRYLEEEFVNKMGGWQKWIFGAGAGMYIAKLNEVIGTYKTNPIVSQLGIFPDGGGVDVDAIYRAVKEQAVKSPVTFDAPMLGSVTLNSADVDKLYNYIRGG